MLVEEPGAGSNFYGLLAVSRCLIQSQPAPRIWFSRSCTIGALPAMSSSRTVRTQQMYFGRSSGVMRNGRA